MRKTAGMYNYSIDCDANSLLTMLEDPIEDFILECIKLMIRSRMANLMAFCGVA